MLILQPALMHGFEVKFENHESLTQQVSSVSIAANKKEITIVVRQPFAGQRETEDLFDIATYAGNSFDKIQVSLLSTTRSVGSVFVFNIKECVKHELLFDYASNKAANHVFVFKYKGNPSIIIPQDDGLIKNIEKQKLGLQKLITMSKVNVLKDKIFWTVDDSNEHQKNGFCSLYLRDAGNGFKFPDDSSPLIDEALAYYKINDSSIRSEPLKYFGYYSSYLNDALSPYNVHKEHTEAFGGVDNEYRTDPKYLKLFKK